MPKQPERELVVYGPFHSTFFNMLRSMGYLKKYHSDLIDEYPSQFKDEDNRWAGIAVEPTRAVYNPNMIEPDKVPSS